MAGARVSEATSDASTPTTQKAPNSRMAGSRLRHRERKPAAVVMAAWFGMRADEAPGTGGGGGDPGADQLARELAAAHFAADDTAAIKLENARAHAPAVLVISDAFGPTPFKGGLLVPSPALLHLILRTQGDGTLEIQFEWDVAVPSGLEIYMQFVIKDPMAIQGYALSNALVLQTP